MEINNKNSKKIIKIRNEKTKCPSCIKQSLEPYTPFCSKKCSDKDLLKWLSDESSINVGI